MLFDKNTDEMYMRLALEEAKKAFAKGEVPIGAVIVQDGKVVGKGFNSTETDKDPSCHAEMKAIREAAKNLGGWRLPNCCMYVTVEPCSMCSGAIVLSRIERLCIGTMDKKAGACGSLMNIVSDERLNHQAEISTGILQQECEKIMKDFFQKLRMKKQKRKASEECTK